MQLPLHLVAHAKLVLKEKSTTALARRRHPLRQLLNQRIGVRPQTRRTRLQNPTLGNWCLLLPTNVIWVSFVVIFVYCMHTMKSVRSFVFFCCWKFFNLCFRQCWWLCMENENITCADDDHMVAIWQVFAFVWVLFSLWAVNVYHSLDCGKVLQSSVPVSVANRNRGRVLHRKWGTYL